MANETDAGSGAIEGGSNGTGGEPDRTLFGDGETIVIDPGKAFGDDPTSGGPSEGGPRKRGRPKGGKNKAQTQEKVAISVSGIEKLLLSLHLGIVALTKDPIWALDNKEANQLAEAIAGAARHYPFLNKLSDKPMDHANLFVALAGIYGTRIATWQIKRADKAQREQSLNGEVITPFRGR